MVSILCFHFLSFFDSSPKFFFPSQALEYWIREIPEKVTPYYPEILPSLNDYLMDTSDSKLRFDMEGEQEAIRAKMKARGRRHTNISKIITSAGGAASAVTGSAVVQDLRFRILKLLGAIAGNNVHVLKTVELTKADGKGLAWDSKDRINFTLPLIDEKPLIALDSILPRVIELAENSVDRKTKVVACELFHSIFVYTLASATLSKETKVPRPTLPPGDTLPIF